MGAEETRHDLTLKRIQATIAILAGIATLVLGVYNIKRTVFAPHVPETASRPAAHPIRAAVEEVGASWIKDFGRPRNRSDATSASTP